MRGGAAVLAVLVAVLGVGRTRIAGAADATLGTTEVQWLHVDHPVGAVPVVRDESGRQVVFRGVNTIGIQDGFYSPRTYDAAWQQPMWSIDPAAYDGGRCPENRHEVSDPPLCEVDAARPAAEQSGRFDSRNDFAQMRALGFDQVRLTISWSQLESTPGVYNTTYIDRIAQVVGWAKAQHVHVLLDMHQDNYSRFLVDSSPVEVPGLLTSVPGSPHHADGAPPWAIVTDGEPSLAPFGSDALNAAMSAAFTSFWRNAAAPVARGAAPGTGLQDHYIGAMAALARRFIDEPAVSGFEIMNEPPSGTFAAPGGFEQGVLFPFYRRVIDAITGLADGAPCPASAPAAAACGYPDLGIHDTRHMFFFEPWAIRNLLDVSPQVSAPFSTYPNLVYAPHTYTHEFTVDRTLVGPSPIPPPTPVPYPVSYDQAFDTASLEAQTLGAALYIGEFGNGSDDDDTLLRDATAAQDRHLAGSAVWEWKNNCAPGTPPNLAGCGGAWSVFAGDTATPPAQNRDVKPSRRRFLSRPYPARTAGDLLSISYDPDAAIFSMVATSGQAVRPGDSARETEVFVPAAVGGRIDVTGAAILDRVETTVDGNRVAYLTPSGAGAYSLAVSDTPASPVPDTGVPALAIASSVAAAALVAVRRRQPKAA